MKKQKIPYEVYIRRRIEAEDQENNVLHAWEYAGSTAAVSEKQAINNVRHNRFGDYGTSQYLPVSTSGHYEVWIDWKAIPKEGYA